MIRFTKGNLLQSGDDALVNTVNCVGVMGKGIALQFRRAYPSNFLAYARACKNGEVRLGEMFVVETGLDRPEPRFIINFPTKDHWRARSRLDDVKSGLESLVREVDQRGIRSVSVPPLGCGNGGLDWSDVRPLIEAAFAGLPGVEVHVYEPAGAPDAKQMRVASTRPRMTRGRSLLVLLLQHYAEEGYAFSKLEIQKLAYLLQAAGEPMTLTFVKHSFGPYAEAVNHVLERLEGHFTRGYGDRSKTRTEIVLLPDAVAEASKFLESDHEAQARLRRVAGLAQGFESLYGMEILATVHWVVAAEPAIADDPDAVVETVWAWNERKRQMFPREHVLAAWEHLRKHGFMPGSVTDPEAGGVQTPT